MEDRTERRAASALFLVDAGGMGAMSFIHLESAATSAQELGAAGLGALALGFLGGAVLTYISDRGHAEHPRDQQTSTNKLG